MFFDSNNTDWDKIKIGLKKYETIMKLFHATDVSRNLDFQRTFNGFYRVKLKSKEFYQTFYEFLELNKNKEISFQETIEHFFKKFDRLESSFSSKILATINPNQPVWDSEVLKRLNLRSPGYNLSPETRFLRILETYNKICNWYDDFLKTDVSKKMLDMFNQKIPNANITDVKKIDFILWQTRDKKSEKSK